MAAQADRDAGVAPVSRLSEGDRLSDHDRSILAFERRWWRHAGAKEEAIRAEFGLSAARYYQILNDVLDDPEALALDPMLVKRLHRIRDARTEARSAGSSAATTITRPDHNH